MNKTEIGSLENMEFRKRRIYLAHPKETYFTEVEMDGLNKIKELYPEYEIINPRDIPIAEEDMNPKNYAEFMRQMQKYYFPVIETCDLVMVIKTKNGKISPGVQKEIPFAELKNIPVEYLDIKYPENFVKGPLILTSNDERIEDYYSFPVVQLFRWQKGKCYGCDTDFGIRDDRKGLSTEDCEWLNENAVKLDEINDNYKIVGHSSGSWYRLYCPSCSGIDLCYGCEYTNMCKHGQMGGKEDIDNKKCKAYIPEFAKENDISDI